MSSLPSELICHFYYGKCILCLLGPHPNPLPEGERNRLGARTMRGARFQFQIPHSRFQSSTVAGSISRRQAKLHLSCCTNSPLLRVEDKLMKIKPVVAP